MAADPCSVTQCLHRLRKSLSGRERASMRMLQVPADMTKDRIEKAKKLKLAVTAGVRPACAHACSRQDCMHSIHGILLVQQPSCRAPPHRPTLGHVALLAVHPLHWRAIPCPYSVSALQCYCTQHTYQRQLCSVTTLCLSAGGLRPHRPARCQSEGHHRCRGELWTSAATTMRLRGH